ncbi:XFP N-terminal domain-containing protein [Lentzea californiensis]|nr:XFP N-terminal domain-containing protein [Lentzea californiensis]
MTTTQIRDTEAVHRYRRACDYAAAAMICLKDNVLLREPLRREHLKPRLELGYALATAFGAALDKPDLLVACLVGDGEAETGPTAGSWHANKYLDPRTDGAVLPVLHILAAIRSNGAPD